MSGKKIISSLPYLVLALIVIFIIGILYRAFTGDERPEPEVKPEPKEIPEYIEVDLTEAREVLKIFEQKNADLSTADRYLQLDIERLVLFLERKTSVSPQQRKIFADSLQHYLLEARDVVAN